VLGPLLVYDTGGRELRLRGDRQRCLLAMLLFHANEIVPTDRLVDALWPDTPPRSYASNLHTYVSRLRERIQPARIDHTGRGYRLIIDDADLDLLIFKTESELGRRTTDPSTAATHFRTALAQWRDHPLADLHLPALESEVARLETERVTVFEECVDAELAAGRHTELIGELRAAVAAHPLSERLAGQLMLALRRSGRQADALAVYRDTRATLTEETGLEPGAELRRIHAEILRGDEPDWPICQLPADIADFSGRRNEITELRTLLTGAPLVVVSGEPGVGKSTLAIRAAHLLRDEFPDGQLFAHLGTRRPGEVLSDLLGSLGLPGPSIPDSTEARAAVFRSRLADRKTLLVLDDAADPAQVRPLLPGTSSTTVLITSRQRLSGLAGARRLPLNPLPDVEACLLLRRIAGARITDDPTTAARIVAACGNLPLALRIAGTRLALRPELRLGLLAERLEDAVRRLDELAVSDLRVRSSLELSYRSLSTRARAALRLIGTIDIPNLPGWAISVLCEGFDADAAIEELIESSLLEPSGVDTSGEPRYRMHDLVRTFAWERSQVEDRPLERQKSTARLIDTGLALTDLAARRLPRTVPIPGFTGDVPAPRLPSDTVDRLIADPDEWFATERPSILAGLARMCATRQHHKAMLIFQRFAHYLWLHGFYADMRSCAAAIAAAAKKAGDAPVEARAEAVLASLLHARGQYAEAVDAYRHSIRRLSRLDDRPALAWALVNLANCLMGIGERTEALELAERAGALFGDDAEFGAMSALHTRSAVLNRLGRAGESVPIDTAALVIARRSGDPLLVALALHSLSWSVALTGELDSAVSLASESVSLLRGTTARSALARSLRTLGAIHAGRGDRDAAVAAFEDARAIAEEINDVPRVLSCTRAIAASWIADGRSAAAIPELRKCLTAHRKMGGRSATTITLRVLATAYEAAGDPRAARHASAEADRLEDPADATAQTLLRLLHNMIEAPGTPLDAPGA
jgi:DNA-binding SARP family transcriptional activator/tetratricopeptide (TPR) repeat protein